MLDWLPLANDFAVSLRAAQQPSAAPDRIANLASLARHRLDFLQILQLDRALRSIGGEAAPEGFRFIRLAVLASATAEHLLPAIRVAGLQRSLWVQAYVSAYGQFRQESIEPSAELLQFSPNAILFAITVPELLGPIRLNAPADEVEEAIAGAIDALRSLWRSVRKTFGASVIQQTFVDGSEPLFGSFDRLVPAAPWRIVATLNARLAEAAAEEGVSLLDIARACERDGREAWFDIRRWLQAKQEIAPQAAPAYGDFLARVLAAQHGLSKKCLVLDLDNTLWSGVVGDDGVEGLTLGNGSAAGEAHLALQRYAKQLKERGIILAVCSKNERTIAEAAVEEHPEMILRMADFAAFRANWDDKVVNLRAIAAELNLGLDSFVFVDDNPAERARVREALPMVSVPELPEDIAGYVSRIAAAGYFEATSFTPEDRDRALQYAANAARDRLRDAIPSVAEFLHSLGMTVTYQPFTKVDLPRVVQLVNKTNQFNLTNRRCNGDEILALIEAAGTISLQFRLTDRFGDNGLVSAMILRRSAQREGVLELDAWVMSCRVFGRELEYEAMSIAVESAHAQGARRIEAEYVPTPKNGVVSELYSRLGFVRSREPSSSPHATRWEMSLEDYVPRQTPITRRRGSP